MQATTKPEKQQPSSIGALQKVLIFLVVVAICVGFLVGLLLVRTRLTSLEETVNGLSEVCKTPSSGSHSNKRNRRDNGTLRLEDVRSEIQTQLRSITASQLCSPPDKICLPGPPGAKGDTGVQGRKGEKGRIGVKGAIGYPGEPGLNGLDGMPGKPGSQGFPGIKGEKGFKGDPGIMGNSGYMGPPGDSGVPGQKGEVGAKGEKGEPGIGS